MRCSAPPAEGGRRLRGLGTGGCGHAGWGGRQLSRSCDAFSFFFPLSCVLLASTDYLVLCCSCASRCCVFVGPPPHSLLLTADNCSSLCHRAKSLSAAGPQLDMGHMSESHMHVLRLLIMLLAFPFTGPAACPCGFSHGHPTLTVPIACGALSTQACDGSTHRRPPRPPCPLPHRGCSPRTTSSRGRGRGPLRCTSSCSRSWGNT